MATYNNSSDSEHQRCCGKDRPMDSLSLYKYTRCKTRYNINKKRAMRSFWLERNILEYAAGLALFEISVVLDYCTTRLENPVVLQTTAGQ